MEDERVKTLAEMAAEADGSAGLVCQSCGSSSFRVYYTRQQTNKILRRRICTQCGQLMTTIERPR